MVGPPNRPPMSHRKSDLGIPLPYSLAKSVHTALMGVYMSRSAHIAMALAMGDTLGICLHLTRL
jgi:hypothetical protein